MRNTKEPTFRAGEPAIEKLMKMLAPYFTSIDIKSASAMGNRLGEIYRGYFRNNELKGAQLTQKLFKPYANGHPCSLSLQHCRLFYNLLREMRDSHVFQDHGDALSGFKDFIEREGLYADDASKKGITSRFLEKKSSAAETWLIYENIEESLTKEKHRGIKVVKIILTPDSKQLEASVIYKHDSELRQDKGIVLYYNRKDNFYIDIIAADNSCKKSLLVLRRSEIDAKSEALMLGYHNCYPTGHNHLTTKTVVLQRIEENKAIVPGDYYEGQENYALIPERIREFYME
jgi:hypothetical protein